MRPPTPRRSAVSKGGAKAAASGMDVSSLVESNARKRTGLYGCIPVFARAHAAAHCSVARCTLPEWLALHCNDLHCTATNCNNVQSATTCKAVTTRSANEFKHPGYPEKRGAGTGLHPRGKSAFPVLDRRVRGHIEVDCGRLIIQRRDRSEREERGPLYSFRLFLCVLCV